MMEQNFVSGEKKGEKKKSETWLGIAKLSLLAS